MDEILKKLGPLSGKQQEPSVEDDAVDENGYPVPPSRRKKKAIMSWHDPEVGTQLKAISKEQGRSQQMLLREAMNLLFSKYGKDQIA